MADSLGATSSAESGYVSQSDLLEQSYRQTEQSKLDALTARKSELEDKQSFFTGLNTRMRSMVSAIDTLTADTANDNFVTRNIKMASQDYFTATASSSAIIGLNQIRVNQLASSDILISDRLTLEEDYGLEAGDYSFTIKNGDNDSFDVTVTMDGDETNEEAMVKIVNAINLTEDIEVSASVIRDTTTTGRLTLTAQETGAENQIFLSSFSPVDAQDEDDEEDTTTGNSANTDKSNHSNKEASELLSKLGFGKNSGILDGDEDKTTDRTVATGSSAGYLKASTEDLNAIIEVNGIQNVTRGSNSIDDVLEGVTLNLTQAMDEDQLPVAMTTEIDTKAVEEFVQPLLNSFNNMIKYLRNDTTLLRSESSLNNLYQNMRSVFAMAVTPGDDGDPRYLAGIGISSNSDGTLYIDDRDRLEELLADDPQLVAHIFTAGAEDFDENDKTQKISADDGLAVKLAKTISAFTGTDGIITSRTQAIGDQIDDTTDRYSKMSDRIDARAYALRKEYEDMLRVYLEAQNQFNYLGTASTTSMTSGY